MQAICGLAGAIAAVAVVASASGPYAQETKLPVPNVTVTAPAAPVEPPYLRNPWKSYERNSYTSRYRVEEQVCYVYMLRVSICRTDPTAMRAEDVAYAFDSVQVRHYDPLGNLRKAGE